MIGRSWIFLDSCVTSVAYSNIHIRPRPDQFPHKQGLLAASTLRTKTPPSSSPSLPLLQPPPPPTQHIPIHSFSLPLFRYPNLPPLSNRNSVLDLRRSWNHHQGHEQQHWSHTRLDPGFKAR